MGIGVVVGVDAATEAVADEVGDGDGDVDADTVESALLEHPFASAQSKRPQPSVVMCFRKSESIVSMYFTYRVDTPSQEQPKQ